MAPAPATVFRMPPWALAAALLAGPLLSLRLVFYCLPAA